MLLEWRFTDPPSQWEEDRNMLIEQEQGNRNLFIDQPELVERVEDFFISLLAAILGGFMKIGEKWKNVIFLSLIIIVAGCASTHEVVYRVNSEPNGAQVDVNGTTLGNTPTEIKLQCSKRWVGVMNAPGGYANASGKYEVKVYPPKGTPGLSQTKNVDPCQWNGQGKPELKFDLNLRSLEPLKQIEIIKKGGDGGKYDKAIESLKFLRDQGVITEQEYEEKVLQLVK